MDTEHSLTQIHETFFIVIEIPNENKLTKRGNYFSNAKKNFVDSKVLFSSDDTSVSVISGSLWYTIIIKNCFSHPRHFFDIGPVLRSWRVTKNTEETSLWVGSRGETIQSLAWLRIHFVFWLVAIESSFTLSLKWIPIF